MSVGVLGALARRGRPVDGRTPALRAPRLLRLGRRHENDDDERGERRAERGRPA